MATYYNNNRTKLSNEQLIDLLIKTGFKDFETLRSAFAIVKRESGGAPNAYLKNTNATYDRGLFQINDINHDYLGITDKLKLYDPAYNAEKAYKLFSNFGWGPWAVPDPDGTLRGWALHLSQKAPDTFAKYNAKYDEFRNYFDQVVSENPALVGDVKKKTQTQIKPVYVIALIVASLYLLNS